MLSRRRFYGVLILAFVASVAGICYVRYQAKGRMRNFARAIGNLAKEFVPEELLRSAKSENEVVTYLQGSFAGTEIRPVIPPTVRFRLSDFQWKPGVPLTLEFAEPVNLKTGDPVRSEDGTQIGVVTKVQSMLPIATQGSRKSLVTIKIDPKIDPAVEWVAVIIPFGLDRSHIQLFRAALNEKELENASSGGTGNR